MRCRCPATVTKTHTQHLDDDDGTLDADETIVKSVPEYETVEALEDRETIGRAVLLPPAGP